LSLGGHGVLSRPVRRHHDEPGHPAVRVRKLGLGAAAAGGRSMIGDVCTVSQAKRTVRGLFDRTVSGPVQRTDQELFWKRATTPCAPTSAPIV
jgi:hypothetical protein